MQQGFAPTRSLGSGQMDTTKSKAWDRRLEDYRATRAEGIQPEGTATRQIEAAKRASDDAGQAFRGDALARAADGRTG